MSLFHHVFSLKRREHVYYLSGKFDFNSVPALWSQSKEVLENKISPVVFDLAGITQSDSSGVALLIAWMRVFNHQSRTVHFINLPKQMLAIIQLTGLQNIIPIKN